MPDRSSCRLEQHPAACAAQCCEVQLSIGQAIELGLRDLAARHKPDADREIVELMLQGADACGDLLDVNVVVRANVRCRADDLDSVLLSLASHPNAVLQVERSIVEPGQDMAVKVDHGGPHFRGASRQRPAGAGNDEADRWQTIGQAYVNCSAAADAPS